MPDYSELIEILNRWVQSAHEIPIELREDLLEAAVALQTLQARIAELESELDQCADLKSLLDKLRRPPALEDTE